MKDVMYNYARNRQTKKALSRDCQGDPGFKISLFMRKQVGGKTTQSTRKPVRKLEVKQ